MAVLRAEEPAGRSETIEQADHTCARSTVISRPVGGQDPAASISASTAWAFSCEVAQKPLVEMLTRGTWTALACLSTAMTTSLYNSGSPPVRFTDSMPQRAPDYHRSGTTIARPAEERKSRV
jgi:hypothetical protein